MTSSSLKLCIFCATAVLEKMVWNEWDSDHFELAFSIGPCQCLFKPSTRLAVTILAITVWKFNKAARITDHSHRLHYLTVKPGFHTCVSRNHNDARCLTMYGHQWSQSIPAFSTKIAHVELLRGLRRDMLWPIETKNARNKKDFLSFEKKEQS